MLALPGSAFAASSSESAYNQPGGTVQDQIETRPASSTGTTPSAAVTTPAQANSDDGGKLPFTGLDLALVVGAGGILLLLGFGIRRFTTGSELA